MRLNKFISQVSESMNEDHHHHIESIKSSSPPSSIVSVQSSIVPPSPDSSVYSFQSLSPSAVSLLTKQLAVVANIPSQSQQFALSNIQPQQFMHQDQQQQQQLAGFIKKKPLKKYKHIQSRPVSQPLELSHQPHQQQQPPSQHVNSGFEMNSSPEEMCMYGDDTPTSTYMPCIDSLSNSYIQVNTHFALN
jgi:hypothetical protein